MANPKRRFSRARTAKRRSTWKLTTLNLIPCPNCREPRLAHRACPTCGRYAGRVVIASAE